MSKFHIYSKRGYLFMILLCGMACMIGCAKYDGDYSYENAAISSYDGTIMEYLAKNNDNQYDSLLEVLDRLPNYKQVLASDSITFVLPTNKNFQLAFENLNQYRISKGRKPLDIHTVDSAKLDTIFARYIINGVYRTSYVEQYSDGIMAFSTNYNIQMNLKYQQSNASGGVNVGPKILQISDTKEAPYISYWTISNTMAVNFECTNGIIHTLSSEHIFGFGEIFNRLNN